MSATVQEPIHISGDMVIIPKKQYKDRRITDEMTTGHPRKKNK